MEKTAKRKTNLNIPTAASIWYMGTNILTKGAVFISTPIFTRLLSPSEYGVYSLYISWMGIFTVIETLEISGALMYRGLTKYKKEKNGFTASALTIQIILTLFVFFIYILFNKGINDITGLTLPLSAMLIIQVFFNSAEGIYFAKERYGYGYKKVCIMNLVTGIITPALALLIISVSEYKSLGRIISLFAVSLLFTLPLCGFIFKKGASKISADKIKFIIKHAIPILPHYLSLSIIAQSDKIILARTFGEGAVGKYSVAASAGMILTLLTTGAASALTPWIMRKLDTGRGDMIKKVSEKAIFAIMIITLMFLSVLPELFSIIASSDYMDALDAVYPISISVILLFLTGMHTTALLHFEKQKAMSCASLMSALISIILNLILIPKFGYMGGACSTLIAYILLLGFDVIILKRSTNKVLIYINKSLLYFSVFMFFVIILNLFKNVFLPRILFLAVFVLLLPYFLADAKALIFENQEKSK